jgi:hypothetical protein
LPLVFAEPGTHLIAFDMHPSSITLPAEKFQTYLRDEGLEFIAKRREASGTAATPGRERFRRFQVLFDGKPLSKALMQVWHKQGSQTSIIKSRLTRGARPM